MPYIKKEGRERLIEALMPLFCGGFPENEGELNYVITAICHEYVESKGVRYATLNAVTGVLESAKLEFYRRVVAPYEDTKIKENGAVSELDRKDNEL